MVGLSSQLLVVSLCSFLSSQSILLRDNPPLWEKITLIFSYNNLGSRKLLSELLLGVIREQGACSFRHKGAGSKAQNSHGSMKIVIREQGVQFLSVRR